MGWVKSKGDPGKLKRAPSFHVDHINVLTAGKTKERYEKIQVQLEDEVKEMENDKEEIEKIIPYMPLLSKPCKGKLNEEYTLYVNFHNEFDREFIKKVHGLRFPQMKQIVFDNMGELNEVHQQLVMEMFEKSFNHKMESLYLNDHGLGFLSPYHNSLKFIFPLVTQQLTIKAFSFDDDRDFKYVIEQSSHIPMLIISNCTVNISEKFALSKKVDYKIVHLNLYETCIKHGSSYLNEEKMHYFCKAINDSSLGQSMKHIWINEGDDYPTKDLQKVLKKHKLDVEIITTEDAPAPLAY